MPFNSLFKTTLGIILLFISNTLNAQNTYLVSIDNSNCGLKVKGAFNNIAEYLGSSYDQSGHRYFLYCKTSNSDYTHLITFDVLSGEIVNDNTFNSLKLYEDITSLCYDDQSGKLYGLFFDRSANKKYFISVDPGSGAYNKINELDSFVQYYQSANYYPVINNTNHTYTFIYSQPIIPLYATNAKLSSGYDSSRIFTIDINTGKLLSSPVTQPIDTFNKYFKFLAYDPILNKYYSLHTDFKTYNIVTVDPFTGKYDNIQATYNAFNYLNFAYDLMQHRFIIYGGKEYSHAFSDQDLVTIDVNAGTLVFNSSFPTPPYFIGTNYYVAPGNIGIMDGLQFDDSLRSLFALRMGNVVNTDSIVLDAPLAFPNPFSSITSVFLKKNYADINVVLLNSVGQISTKFSADNTNIITINKNGLAPGEYFALIYGDGVKIGTVKLDIQ